MQSGGVGASGGWDIGEGATMPRRPVEGDSRKLHIAGGRGQVPPQWGEYESNYISTTKYPSWFVFLPMNLF